MEGGSSQSKALLNRPEVAKDKRLPMLIVGLCWTSAN